MSRMYAPMQLEGTEQQMQLEGTEEESSDVHSDHTDEQEFAYPCPKDCYGDMFTTFLSTISGHDIYSEPVHYMNGRDTEAVPDDEDELSAVPKGKRFMWMLMSCIIFAINVVVQLGLSSALYFTFLEHVSLPYQKGLNEKGDSIRVSVANKVKLGDDDEAYQLCQANKTITYAYPVVLFLWFTRMIEELFDSLWLLYVFYKVPTIDSSDGEIKEVLLTGTVDEDESGAQVRVYNLPSVQMQFTGRKPDKTFRIVAMSTVGHTFAIGVVASVKLIAAAWITWVGAKFLVYAHLMSSLVFKALAMQYFVTIDELLFNGFVSKQKKDRVAKTSIKYYAVQNQTSKMWGRWLSSLVRLTVVMSMVLFTHYYLYADLMDFRHQCALYFAQFPEAGQQHHQYLQGALTGNLR